MLEFPVATDNEQTCADLRVTTSCLCANYALKRVAIDNEDEFLIAAKAIQSNFHMEDFIKSVDTPDEAINVFKQLQLFCQDMDSN